MDTPEVDTPSRWDVALRKTLGSGATRFELDLTLRSDAARLVLYGPSGAGKSVTLKAIAGLLTPDAGHVRFAGETLFDAAARINLPPDRRRLGYLFQEYALFPHLTVRQNVAFGATRGIFNPRPDAVPGTVDRWLQTLELSTLAGRYPDQLSGGQRQRTALARALVAEPRALLLDEPFAALDTALRARLRDELAELVQALALPLVLITHDPADVAALADEVVDVDHGRAAGSTVASIRAAS